MMTNRSIRCAMTLCACIALLSQPDGVAQTLEKIDQSIDQAQTKQPPPPKGPVPQPPPAHAHQHHACIFDPISDAACYAGGVALFYGGIVSWERATCNVPVSENGEPAYEPRMAGDPLIPQLRLDGQWVPTGDEVSVLDTRLEAGFGPLAIDWRNSSFDEDATEFDLTLSRWHVLYRMSFGDTIELDIGMGGVEVDGERTHDGFSFTAPLRFHPYKHFGIEIWPSWSEVNGTRVDDYDINLLLNLGWVSIKPGYRVWNFGDETLEGPALGISFHW